MPVELDKAMFYHIPKTGGTYVRTVLDQFGKEDIRFKVNHELNLSGFHVPPRLCPTDKFSFAFVRHPVTWYQSYWKARVDSAWHRQSIFDDFGGTFEDWARNLIKNYPHVFTRIMEEFSWVDFMGRQENLINDLSIALNLAGIEHEKESLIREKINVSGKKTSAEEEKKGISVEIRELICENERLVINKFYKGSYY